MCGSYRPSRRRLCRLCEVMCEVMCQVVCEVMCQVMCEVMCPVMCQVIVIVIPTVWGDCPVIPMSFIPMSLCQGTVKDMVYQCLCVRAVSSSYQRHSLTYTTRTCAHARTQARTHAYVHICVYITYRMPRRGALRGWRVRGEEDLVVEEINVVAQVGVGQDKPNPPSPPPAPLCLLTRISLL
jgi:hypothetical protein